MTSLYDRYLPLVQSLNDYGGNYTSIHIRRAVLDAIDTGASNDPSLASVQDKLRTKMQQWAGLQDHETFSPDHATGGALLHACRSGALR
jgi:hypothetical protein